MAERGVLTVLPPTGLFFLSPPFLPLPPLSLPLSTRPAVNLKCQPAVLSARTEWRRQQWLYTVFSLLAKKSSSHDGHCVILANKAGPLPGSWSTVKYFISRDKQFSSHGPATHVGEGGGGGLHRWDWLDVKKECRSLHWMRPVAADNNSFIASFTASTLKITFRSHLLFVCNSMVCFCTKEKEIKKHKWVLRLDWSWKLRTYILINSSDFR